METLVLDDDSGVIVEEKPHCTKCTHAFGCVAPINFSGIGEQVMEYTKVSAEETTEWIGTYAEKCPRFDHKEE